MMYGCYITRTLEFLDGHKEESQKLLSYTTYEQAKKEYNKQIEKAHNSLGFADRKRVHRLIHIDVSIVEITLDDFTWTGEVEGFDYVDPDYERYI